MRDNLSIIIVMLVFVILIVIFPLYNYFERQDDMSYNLVLKATTNFVDEVINCGYIDQEMYDNYVNEIAVTGNSYDIQVEAHKRTYTLDPYTRDAAGNLEEDVYIEQYNIDYTDDIFDTNTGIPSGGNVNGSNKVLKDGTYFLNIGDQIYVKLKNTNQTMASAIFNMIVPTSKSERVTVNYGGIIKNNAWEEQALSNLIKELAFVNIRLSDDTPGNPVSPTPTFSLDSTNNYTVKFELDVQNAATGINIANILTNEVKLVGFANSRVLENPTVTSIGDKWSVTFDLKAKIPSGEADTYFGGLNEINVYAQLEKDKIMSKSDATTGNPLTQSSYIKIVRSSASVEHPVISGPYKGNDATLLSGASLGADVWYEIRYGTTPLKITTTDELKNYIGLVNATADVEITHDSAGKRYIVAFKSINGTVGNQFSLEVNNLQYEALDGSTQNYNTTHGLTTILAPDFTFTKNDPGCAKVEIPFDGTYEITVVGADGGGTSGGQGGMSYGKISLTKGVNLWVVVGGTTNTTSGGYNGGGTGTSYGGGGATDVRILSGSETLNDTTIFNTNMLTRRIIVAGGGGGAGACDDASKTYNCSGGAGGGANLSGGHGMLDGAQSANPGTLDAGNALGKGQKATEGRYGGGGGGYHGGYIGLKKALDEGVYCYSGGGGGSGYVNTSSGMNSVSGQNGYANASSNGSVIIKYIGP